MKSIQVANLIFTRLEAEFSPYRRSGFQTAYKSQTVSDNLARDIETRIQCFTSPDGRGRLQFFVVGDFAIVSKTNLIESNLSVIDRSGRGGVFLAHAVIIALPEFKALNNNPFALLDSFTPITDASSLVNIMQGNNELPHRLEVIQSAPHETQQLPFAEIFKLVNSIPQNNKDDRAVMYGSAKGIEDTLRLVLSLLAPPQRIFCSFDTCLDRCNLPKEISYWAKGYSQKPSGSFSTVVDLENNRINLLNENKEKNLYTTWLEKAALKDDLSEVIKGVDDAFEITNALENSQALPNHRSIDHKVANEVFRVHQNLVTKKLIYTFEKWLPHDLAADFTDFLTSLFRYPEFLMPALSVAASGKISPNLLSGWVMKWFVEKPKEISTGSLKQLKTVAREGENYRLLFHLSTAFSSQDNKARDEALQLMATADFQEELDYLLKPIEVEHFVHERFIQVLINTLKHHNVNHNQAIKLMARMIDLHLESSLDGVVYLLKDLKREEVSVLEKAIRKNKKVSPTFKQAVAKQRQKVGRNPSFFKRFRLIKR